MGKFGPPRNQTSYISHYRRKEIVSGGHDKENFFERHYFLKLQSNFQKSEGGHMPPRPPVPTALYHLKVNDESFPKMYFY